MIGEIQLLTNMIIRLKKTYLLFLITGITSLISCGGTVEPGESIVTFKYLNSSSEVLIYDGSEMAMASVLEREVVHFGINGSNYQNCCQGILEDVQGAFNQVYLELGGGEIVCFLEDQGPTQIANYSAARPSKRSYEFSFTFTDVAIASYTLRD